ncbi:MAG: type II toxin-antitoxin system HicA family toxin [Bacteroidota bacterium]
MKRIDLIRHLEKHGCELLREGGNHSVYVTERVNDFETLPVRI